MSNVSRHMEPAQAVVAILGGQAVLLAAAAWLARSFMSQVLAKELERFRAELSRETALSIERFKHDLQVQAHEKQTSFARVYEVTSSGRLRLPTATAHVER